MEELIEYGTSHGLGKLGAGIRLWANINPVLLLSVFLPALLFESSFAMEVHQIKRCMAQMLLLAGPGVLISTFCLGALLKITFPYNWNWNTSLLLGGLLSATDPVAVVALLKELGASKKLNTIIEGESLMNDGTAIVVFQLFYRMVLGQNFNVGDIIKFLSKVSFGAVAMGLAFGIASVLWLGFIFNDTVIEIALTLAVSYLAFFTAQDGADVSGVLTVMTLGMFYAAVARTAFKGDGQQSLHHFWYNLYLLVFFYGTNNIR
ncbi:putative Sodium/hydrogen exchanger 7 [Cocos nucifera]|nr:putative Sodium/hydrogen exchanger 7 [Cocos nucifera]